MHCGWSEKLFWCWIYVNQLKETSQANSLTSGNKSAMSFTAVKILLEQGMKLKVKRVPLSFNFTTKVPTLVYFKSTTMGMV